MVTFHVLTDFSAAASNALHYAVVLAQHLGGHIKVWHAWAGAAGIEAAFLQSSGGVVRPFVQMQQKLQRLAAEVGRTVPCTAEVLHEAPTSHLQAALGNDTGNVLVVGNANPVKKLMAATTSTALHLVRTVAQPLLVVPATFRPARPPRRIVLDTDRRAVRLPPSAGTIPLLLSQVAGSHHPFHLSGAPGEIEYLLGRLLPEALGIHVYTTEHPPAVEELARSIQQTGLLNGVAHTVAASRHPSIEEGIRHAASRHRADLLTFVTRQRMYVGASFYQCVTAGLLAHSRIPVLTVPEA